MKDIVLKMCTLSKVVSYIDKEDLDNIICSK